MQYSEWSTTSRVACLWQMQSLNCYVDARDIVLCLRVFCSLYWFLCVFWYSLLLRKRIHQLALTKLTFIRLFLSRTFHPFSRFLSELLAIFYAILHIFVCINCGLYFVLFEYFMKTKRDLISPRCVWVFGSAIRHSSCIFLFTTSTKEKKLYAHSSGWWPFCVGKQWMPSKNGISWIEIFRALLFLAMNTEVRLFSLILNSRRITAWRIYSLLFGHSFYFFFGANIFPCRVLWLRQMAYCFFFVTQIERERMRIKEGQKSTLHHHVKLHELGELRTNALKGNLVSLISFAYGKNGFFLGLGKCETLSEKEW